jgi:hypothetical protein
MTPVDSSDSTQQPTTGQQQRAGPSGTDHPQPQGHRNAGNDKPPSTLATLQDLATAAHYLAIIVFHSILRLPAWPCARVILAHNLSDNRLSQQRPWSMGEKRSSSGHEALVWHDAITSALLWHDAITSALLCIPS